MCFYYGTSVNRKLPFLAEAGGECLCFRIRDTTYKNV